MNILVVGNVIKDTYLNLDTRTEQLETDSHNTPWLDISFDASEHYFFNHNSSLGGAAISLEVLTKMGLSCQITNSDTHLDADGLVSTSSPVTYRYILIADSKSSYFAPSKRPLTKFAPPTSPIDYLYIDRSAELDNTTITQIKDYLANHNTTRLIIYINSSNIRHIKSLLPHASLIILENTSHEDQPLLTSALKDTPKSKIIQLSNTSLSYQSIKEPLSLHRLDITTHLSAYSIAAATIVGGFALGYTASDTIKLARVNTEHSKLNSSLSLSSMQNLLSNTPVRASLELTAASLMLPGKGILAADESGGSIKKKFAKLSIPDTYDTRRDYRNIFFTTPDIEKYLTGIILFDETAHQHADNGQTYIDYLTAKRIIPGIKVDQGLATFDNSLETYTKGLTGLEDRLSTYYNEGLRFAKWRAAFNIRLSTSGDILTPTTHAIMQNCIILAKYAKLCQAANIIPIVEPEVVYDGYYSLSDNAKVTGQILDKLFVELQKAKVNLRACILKVNMVLAGKHYSHQPTPSEIGHTTAEVLRSHVPKELAGIVFLSGGQTPEQATANLSAITKCGPFPWPITFSFARALQDPALYAWSGNNANITIAQKAFLERVIANADALNTPS